MQRLDEEGIVNGPFHTIVKMAIENESESVVMPTFRAGEQFFAQ